MISLDNLALLMYQAHPFSSTSHRSFQHNRETNFFANPKRFFRTLQRLLRTGNHRNLCGDHAFACGDLISHRFHRLR